MIREADKGCMGLIQVMNRGYLGFHHNFPTKIFSYTDLCTTLLSSCSAECRERCQPKFSTPKPLSHFSSEWEEVVNSAYAAWNWTSASPRAQLTSEREDGDFAYLNRQSFEEPTLNMLWLLHHCDVTAGIEPFRLLLFADITVLSESGLVWLCVGSAEHAL